MLRAFLRAPSALLGLVSVAALLMVAILAPPLLTGRAIAFDLSLANAGPAWAHILGEDQLGRDIFIRLLVASRLTLGLALAATALGAVLGIPLGALGAVLPERFRPIALRAIDALIAFPPILVAIFVGAIVGPGAFGATLGVGIASSFGFARVASALALSIGGLEYIAAARVLGVRGPRLIFRHILPNMAEALVITITVSISAAIVAIASLSFIGIGVQAPQFDWGSMLTSGVQALYETPAAAIGPMVTIAIAALAFGFLGEAAARATNPVLWARSGGEYARILAPTGGAASLLIGTFAQIFSPKAAGTMLDSFTTRGATSEAQPTSNLAHEIAPDYMPGIPGMLEVKNLSVSLPGNRGGDYGIVDGISFTLQRGDMVGIVGESGSGKTMTAMAIAQLVPYPGKVTGEVILNGRQLQNIPIRELDHLLGTKLAIVFQDPMSSLNPALRIGPQMTERVEVHEQKSRRVARSLAVRKLGEANISAPERQLDKYPHELSGGMRQRVMIAMGLMTEPALLIADEPTTALDVTIQAQIMDLLSAIRADYDATVILISHNLGLVSQNCNRIIVMYAGRIVEDLSASQLLLEPKHPYTVALLAAVPDMMRSRELPLESIPGQAPDLASVPPGCPYHPRCSWAVDICRAVRPMLRERPDGTRVACHVANRDLS